MPDLEDRVALVIGGASGMGLAACQTLAAKGATVVIADLDGEAAERAANDIIAARGQARAYQVDASSIPELRSLFDFVAKAYGRLNVLFIAAGAKCAGGFDITEEQFDEAFDLNLKTHFFATKHALPLMRPCAPRASIIYMSSAGALASAESGMRSPLYTISKASILKMMRLFARHLGPDGIRANALCPGWVDTAFARLDDAEYEGRVARSLPHIPLGRIGQPSEIADVVAFLASDQSTYLTGLSIPIDGGMTA